MAEAALAWAEAGFYVFPCEAGDFDARKQKWSKRPHRMLDALAPARGQGGWKLATREAAQIAAWWETDPAALIGIPPGMSDAVVLDVDGPDGVRQLYERAEDFDLYTTFQARTPGDGGGMHVWFLRDPMRGEEARGRIIGNGRLSHIRGEARADRGYVIAPPSTLPDGGLYEVASHTSVLAVLPEWAVFELPWEKEGTRTGIADITTGEQQEWLDRHSVVIGPNSSDANDLIEQAKAALRSAVVGDENLGRDPTMKHWVGKLLTAAQHGLRIDLSAALADIGEVFLEVKPKGAHDYARFVSDAVALRVAEDRHSYLDLSEIPTWDETRWKKADEKYEPVVSVATRVSGLPEPTIPLPPGLRLYQRGDLAGVVPPIDTDAVTLGPLGEWMAEREPETEASLTSLGLGALVALSAWYGRDFILAVGAIKHPPRLFGVQVGPTGKARKGTADAEIMRLMKAVDLDFCHHHVSSGFGSGEALIERLSDVRRDRAGNVMGGNEDQRVWIREGEFSKLLKVSNREGQIFSDVLRLGFDGISSIENRTKGKQLVSNAHAIGLWGGITPEELLELFPVLATLSGFGNRFLWAWSLPNKLLPSGGADTPVEGYASAIRRARNRLRDHLGINTLYFTSEGEWWWREMYGPLRDLDPVPPGMHAMATRVSDLTQRIALIYALTEGSDQVSVRHLEAGLAWVNYSLATVTVVFGGMVRDPVATKILASLRRHPGVPSTRSELHRVFGRNETAETISSALDELAASGLVHSWTVPPGPTGGRAYELTVATFPYSLENQEVGSFVTDKSASEGAGLVPEVDSYKPHVGGYFVTPSGKPQNPQSVEGENKNETTALRALFVSDTNEPTSHETPEEAPAGEEEEAPAREEEEAPAREEAPAPAGEVGFGLEVSLPASPQEDEIAGSSPDTRVSEAPPAPSSPAGDADCPKCRMGHVSPLANGMASCQNPTCDFGVPLFIWNKHRKETPG